MKPLIDDRVCPLTGCDQGGRKEDDRTGFDPAPGFPSPGLGSSDDGFQQARQEVARKNYTQVYIEGRDHHNITDKFHLET